MGVSRQCIAYSLDNWAPVWATFVSHVSMLSMDHQHYSKETLRQHIEKGLNKVTHLFDGKDIITETTGNDDSIKRRLRSEKWHESAARTINFQPLWVYRLRKLEQ